MNTAFAFTMHDARTPTSAGPEIQQNKPVRPISTISKLITQRGGCLSTYFDIIDEIENAIEDTSLKQRLNKNHKEPNTRHLPVGDIFGFCKSFRKATKALDLN